MTCPKLTGLFLSWICVCSHAFPVPMGELLPPSAMGAPNPPKLPPPKFLPRPGEGKPPHRHGEEGYRPNLPPIGGIDAAPPARLLPNQGSGEFPSAGKLPPPPSIDKQHLPAISVLDNDYFRALLAEIDGSSEPSSGDESKLNANAVGDDPYAVGSALSIKSPVDEGSAHALSWKEHDAFLKQSSEKFPVPNFQNLDIKPPKIKPMAPVQVALNTGKTGEDANTTSIAITYVPFLTIPDGLTQAEWDFDSQHPGLFNPFEYEVLVISDDCYIIREMAGVSITAENLWQIRILDTDQKVIMARFCVPTTKLILQAGYTIDIAYIDVGSIKNDQQ